MEAPLLEQGRSGGSGGKSKALSEQLGCLEGQVQVREQVRLPVKDVGFACHAPCLTGALQSFPVEVQSFVEPTLHVRVNGEVVERDRELNWGTDHFEDFVGAQVDRVSLEGFAQGCLECGQRRESIDETVTLSRVTQQPDCLLRQGLGLLQIGPGSEDGQCPQPEDDRSLEPSALLRKVCFSHGGGLQGLFVVPTSESTEGPLPIGRAQERLV